MHFLHFAQKSRIFLLDLPAGFCLTKIVKLWYNVKFGAFWQSSAPKRSELVNREKTAFLGGFFGKSVLFVKVHNCRKDFVPHFADFFRVLFCVVYCPFGCSVFVL